MESATPKLFEAIPIFPQRDIIFRDRRGNLKRIVRFFTGLQAKPYNLEQWLLKQKEGWHWDIVNSNNGYVMGFGEDGKLIFKQIAQRLQSLHHECHYCGSLFESIRISHDLNVTFSTFPIEAKDDEDLRQGIMIDTLQFRSLVAKMITNEIELSDNESKPQLSKGILLFFSEIFTDRVQSNELQDVKDYSYFQMFHPVFFDSSDRTDFMYSTAQYREINPKAFDENLNLRDKNYGLSSWELKSSSIIHKCLMRDQNINNIPTLIRNTLVHFKKSDEGKGRTHEYIENSVNKEFPDICAKLLDCLMRNLNHPPSFGGCKLVDLFKKKPMRLYTRPYGIDERKGG